MERCEVENYIEPKRAYTVQGVYLLVSRFEGFKEHRSRERIARSSSDLKCKPAGSTSWFAFVVARYDSKQPARTAFLRKLGQKVHTP